MGLRQMLIKRRRRKIAQTEKRLKDDYGTLFDEIAALLFRADPIGLNFDDNLEEYGPEARTILPRLKTCNSADEVLAVVHQEFVRWFEPDTAGPMSRYREIADDIWWLWQQHKLRETERTSP